MDAKSIRRLTAAQWRDRFAERFADHDRNLAFDPAALRALRQPPPNPVRPVPSLSELVIEAKKIV